MTFTANEKSILMGPFVSNGHKCLNKELYILSPVGRMESYVYQRIENERRFCKESQQFELHVGCFGYSEKGHLNTHYCVWCPCKQVNTCKINVKSLQANCALDELSVPSVEVL